jgi:transcriptional regulator with XRE-family HTH domain
MEKEQNSIPALMPDFLAGLGRFCRAEHGRVSRLAADLGIAQPHVSAWLTGRQAPSGEYVLRIQAWLGRHDGVRRRPRSTGVARGEIDVTGKTPVAPAVQTPEAEEIPVWLL